MAPVSEKQTLTETSSQHKGVNLNNVGTRVLKAKTKPGNGTDSRGGRKRHAGSLPTCQVCFNPGSGFHYGADTCEPCKTFFRRNVSLKEKLECRRGNACKPSPSKKFKCTSCRLKRCLEVGMSLEGIKLGRYTDSKRAENKAFEESLKLLSTNPVPTKDQELPHPLPFLMTPPDTPTEDDMQDIPSPKSSKSAAAEQPKNDSISPEINNAINSLLVETNAVNGAEQSAQIIAFQEKSPSYQNTFLGEGEALSIQTITEPIPDREREICLTGISFSAPSGQEGATGNLSHPDLIRSTTLNTLPEINQPQTSTSFLLDSILYDNVKYSTVQQASVPPDLNSTSPLALFLGENDMVSENGPNNSNIGSSNLTGITSGSPFDSPNTDKQARNELLIATSPTIPIPTLDTSSPVSMSTTFSPVYSQASETMAEMHDPPQDMPFDQTVPPLVSGATSIFLDTFIDHISNIYNHYDAHGSDFFQHIHKLFFEYLEAKSMKKRMFGSLRPLPLPEYRQILLETGLDVDGRLQQLTHRQLPNYEKGYLLYLNFVRDVPGFRDLHMEDQDILIKGGRIDYWMLSEFDCFNVEMGLHALPDGFVMGVEDKALVFGRPFIKRMFLAAGKFQKLGLSERERNLLKCIYIFSRGNNCSTPEGIATTKKHYAFFRQVLQYCREREGRLEISNELDSRLEPLMSELGELEENDWEEFFALWKDFPMIRFPPVTKSFYFGSPTSDHSPVSLS